MRFVFKMFVLVGMILVGKFLKEDTSTNSTVGKKETVTTVGDSYSLKSETPFTQQIRGVDVPKNLEEKNTEETYTYSLN